MDTQFTVDYFIKKFQGIEESDWATQLWRDDFGRCCAAGHCGKRDYESTEEYYGLEKVFEVLKQKMNTPLQWFSLDDGGVITAINDGAAVEYPQTTPKKRIIAALYDIKKMQEPKAPTYENITKSLAVIPIEETADAGIKRINHEYNTHTEC